MAVTITANGTRVGQTNYLLDGGNNVDEYTNVNAPFPMPDALQEFSVQTSNYSAEYGRTPAGWSTSSPGAEAAGTMVICSSISAIEYFNAANYFSYVNGVKTVDPLKRNQFGGTCGRASQRFPAFSTLITPSSSSAIRRRSSIRPTSATAAVLPTAAQLAGNFNFTHERSSWKCGFQRRLHCESIARNSPANAGQCYPYIANGGTSYTSHIPTTSYNSASLALVEVSANG